MIISLISQKGGVGKSSLARFIAVEFTRAQWSVKVADLDTGQGSTAHWKGRRDQNEIEPEILVEKYARVERAIKDAEHFQLMILDGPAFAEKGGLKMAQASDLVIIPTGYSLDDLMPQVETAQDLKLKGIDPGKIFFVFCRVPAGITASEDQSARGYLKRADMNVLENVFPERHSIRHAQNNGMAASEVSHKSVKEKLLPLATEIHSLSVPQTETNKREILEVNS